MPVDKTQQWKSDKAAEAYRKGRHPAPEPLLKRLLEFVAKSASSFDNCVDVGCGPGTNTKILAGHFKHVYGVDTSEAQIEEAKRVNTRSNLDYHVGSASDFGVAPGSTDLVTAFVAAHWFDLKAFVGECNRVLKPGGVVALASYRQFPAIVCPESSDAEEAMNAVSDELHDRFRNQGYYLQHLEDLKYDKYVCYDPLFAYPELDRFDEIQEVNVTLEGIVKRIESISGTQNYLTEHPNSTLLADTEKQLRDILSKHNCSGNSLKFRYTWFCVCYRKPQ